MFIVCVLAEARSHSGLWSTNGVEPGTRTLAAGMATSGALTGWLRRIAGDPPFEQLVEEAAATPPGAGGLVVLPYFAGERTPMFDPHARGTILGLTLSHERGHLYRALLEATAYGVRHNLETIAEAGGGAERLVAVGGGTRGGLWTQIVSDVTGRPQELPAHTIGAAYGDALLAGRAAGLVDDGADWNPIAATIEPDEGNAEVYEELYGLFRELYPATRAQAHALAALQSEKSISREGSRR
jgi:xylulokinase